MLHAASVISGIVAAILFVRAVSLAVAGRTAKSADERDKLATSMRAHHRIGAAACLIVVCHGVVSIVNAAMTHDYSQVSVMAAVLILVVLILIDISGHAVRHKGHAWGRTHGILAAVLLVLVVIHVAAALPM